MPPSLTVTPNPTRPDRVVVEGAGFDPAVFVALVFDGSGTTIKVPVRPDGGFSVGQYIASTKPDGAYGLEARKHGTKQVLASTRITVRRALTPPAPPPAPEPTPQPTPPPPPAGQVVAIGEFKAKLGRTDTAPGTYLVAPGTHPLPDPTYLFASGVTVAPQSSTPVIAPPARPNGLFVKGSSNTVRGLSLVGAPSAAGQYNDSSGSALLEILGNDAPVRDTLIEDIELRMPAGAGSRQHAVYVAYDVERLTMRRIHTYGSAAAGGQGDGLTGYHEGKAPTRDIVLEDWIFEDHFNAVVFWLRCDSLTFRRCRSTGTRNVDLQLRTYGPVYFEGCDFRKPVLADPGTTVVDRGGNTWR